MANRFAQECCQPIRRKQVLGKRIDDETAQLKFGNRGRAVAGGSPFEPVGGASVIAIGASAFARPGAEYHRSAATLARGRNPYRQPNAISSDHG